MQGFLKKQFECADDAFQRAALRRAGQWFERERDNRRALQYYAAIGDYEAFLHVNMVSFDLVGSSDPRDRDMVLDLLDNCPKEILAAHPRSMIVVAFALFAYNERERLAELCEGITAMIEGNGALSRREKDGLQGELLLLFSFTKYNDISAMSALHRKAHGLLRGRATLISMEGPWTFGNPSVLFMFYRECGKLEQELACMDECMPFYYELTGGHGRGAEDCMRAEALLNRGEAEEAEIQAYRAVYAAQDRGQGSIELCAWFTLARIALLRGEGERYANAMQCLHGLLEKKPQQFYLYTAELCDGFAGGLLGEVDESVSWLQSGEIPAGAMRIMALPFAHIVLGKAFLLKGEMTKLLGWANQALAIAGIFPNLLTGIYVQIYRSAAHWALGDRERAAEALRAALAIALPDGLLLPFVEHYSWIGPVLEDCKWNEGAAGAIDRIGRMEVAQKKGVARAIDCIQRQKGKLTAREREVALLAMQGRTNKEIGSELFISQETVKMLLRRIFEKTGIHSRAQLFTVVKP